jgi:hypothetical protein
MLFGLSIALFASVSILWPMSHLRSDAVWCVFRVNEAAGRAYQARIYSGAGWIQLSFDEIAIPQTLPRDLLYWSSSRFRYITESRPESPLSRPWIGGIVSESIFGSFGIRRIESMTTYEGEHRTSPIHTGYSVETETALTITHKIFFPYWFLFLLLLIRPICAFRRWRLRNERLTRGLCLGCGYDLCATPDRCPECGAAAERFDGPLREGALRIWN